MDKLIFKIKVNIYEVKELKVLEEKILAEGRALNENVLKVDSFINHKVDQMCIRDSLEDVLPE